MRLRGRQRNEGMGSSVSDYMVIVYCVGVSPPLARLIHVSSTSRVSCNDGVLLLTLAVIRNKTLITSSEGRAGVGRGKVR